VVVILECGSNRLGEAGSGLLMASEIS